MEKIKGFSIPNWQCSPHTPALPDDMIHIWCASLHLPSKEISKSYTSLSADEKRRAEKMIFLEDRKKFIAAHGILRDILARYLQVNPAEIELSCSPQGKPYLTDSSNCKGLCFNLSHSHDMALYAFALKRKVGIDLEYIREDFNWNDIAGIFLSPMEESRLQETPKNIRCRKMCTYWTRKEAVLKSIGTGLAMDPKNINVLKRSGSSDGEIQSNLFTGPEREWSLLDLDLGSDYAASLAVEGKGAKIQYWKWQPVPFGFGLH